MPPIWAAYLIRGHTIAQNLKVRQWITPIPTAIGGITFNGVHSTIINPFHDANMISFAVQSAAFFIFPVKEDNYTGGGSDVSTSPLIVLFEPIDTSAFFIKLNGIGLGELICNDRLGEPFRKCYYSNNKEAISMLIYLSMIETPEDKDKFEQIYYKYRDLMYYVANQKLSNHHDSEDAVHQAFVSIIKHISKIKDIDSPKTRSFIVLITERKAIDIMRTGHRDKVVELNEAITGIDIPLPGDHGIADAISRLPAEYREILMLKFDNGFSNKELAQMIGISESGIRKLIGRARKALKTELDKEGVWF